MTRMEIEPFAPSAQILLLIQTMSEYQLDELILIKLVYSI